METKTLNCMDLARLAMASFGFFPKGERMTFSTAITPYQAAVAHLILHAPNGRIVIVKKRSPKGGWGSPRFTSNPDLLRKRRRTTFHIVVEETDHG